jgi:ssDNA thymidine ADP-ribosyltransferase, DarT
MKPDEFLKRFHPICFYHFTDSRNLESIRKNGGLHPLATLREKQIDIAAPGGNDWSHDADERRGLHKFVHLCLRDQHPMEYVVRKEGRIVESVYLKIKPEIIGCEGIRFTPDVSNKKDVPLLTLAEAVEELDLEVIYRWTNWRDPEIQKRLRKAAKYELLIPQSIPLKLIENI